MTTILTYETAHRKTTETINGLYLAGDKVNKIYTIPFKTRPQRNPLYIHRPNQSVGAHPKDIARHYGIEYIRLDDVNEFPVVDDYILIMTGVILSEETIGKNRIVNCHPGLIPTIRGLDAFKWAIYDKKPLGVTLHFIDKEVDAGEHIFSMPTPVFASDTFESLSTRHYQNEMHVICNYRKYLENKNSHLYPHDVGKAHVRMSAEKEKMMIERFNEYIKEYSK